MEFRHVLTQKQQSGRRHHEAYLHFQSTSISSSFTKWIINPFGYEPKIDNVMSQQVLIAEIQARFSKLRIWTWFSNFREVGKTRLFPWISSSLVWHTRHQTVGHWAAPRHEIMPKSQGWKKVPLVRVKLPPVREMHNMCIYICIDG